MKKTYCDICGDEVGYNAVDLELVERTGHGVKINWDLCFDCGRLIEKAVRTIMINAKKSR